MLKFYINKYNYKLNYMNKIKLNYYIKYYYYYFIIDDYIIKLLLF